MAMPSDKPKDKKDEGDPPKKDEKKKEEKNLWFCHRCDVHYGWSGLERHRYCYRYTPLTPESQADDEELKDDK